MAKTGKAGIGSFVMRDHEYLVAIVSEQGMLRAEVLRYLDELRTPERSGCPRPSRATRRACARSPRRSTRSRSEDRLPPSSPTRGRDAARVRRAKGEVRQGRDLDGRSRRRRGRCRDSAQVIDLVQVLRDSLGASAKKAPATKSAANAPAATKSAAKKTKAPAAKKAATKKAARSAA
jgi:DNA end-binding protein Ku